MAGCKRKSKQTKNPKQKVRLLLATCFNSAESQEKALTQKAAAKANEVMDQETGGTGINEYR